MSVNWNELSNIPRSVPLPTWQSRVREHVLYLRRIGARDIHIRPIRSVVIVTGFFLGYEEVIKVNKPQDADQDSQDPEESESQASEDSSSDESDIPAARCCGCSAIGPIGNPCTESECEDSGNIYADPIDNA